MEITEEYKRWHIIQVGKMIMQWNIYSDQGFVYFNELLFYCMKEMMSRKENKEAVTEKEKEKKDQGNKII